MPRNVTLEEIKEEQEPKLMLIEIGYSDCLIVSWENGIAILKILETAEVYKEEFDKPKVIKELDTTTKIRMKIMSSAEYKRIKLESLIREENDT